MGNGFKLVHNVPLQEYFNEMNVCELTVRHVLSAKKTEHYYFENQI